MTLKTVTLAAVVLGCAAVTARAASASAEMHGLGANTAIKGMVSLEDTAAGLHIKAQLANVSPGSHGFHIHEFGFCDQDGKAAGGHYNPMGAPHGMIMKDGMQKAHPGDMGNITADKTGGASLELTIPGISIADGNYTVGGRAIVLHEKADDFGQPVGNAGGRIACGTIKLTSATSK